MDDAVYNFHSTNDSVLKYLYAASQAGQTAAGCKGYSPASPKLKNIDVSDQVMGHSEYHPNVTLR